MRSERANPPKRSETGLRRGPCAAAQGSLLLALGLSLVPLRAARAEDASRAVMDVEEEEPSEDDRLGVLGLSVEAGVPDGLAASLVIRPASWIRFQGGANYNLVSQGVHAGVSVIPLDLWLLKLSLNAEAGVYFPGDANKAVRMFDPTAADINLLSRVGYRYANGHVGVELGGDTFCLYVHAGWTYLHASFAQGSQELGDGAVVFNGSPTVTAFIPSAKAGLMLFLF